MAEVPGVGERAGAAGLDWESDGGEVITSRQERAAIKVSSRDLPPLPRFFDYVCKCSANDSSEVFV